MYFAATMAVGLIMDGLQILLGLVYHLVFVFCLTTFLKYESVNSNRLVTPHLSERGLWVCNAQFLD